MTTPRPVRRPLGSLAGNGSQLNGFSRDFPERDERDLAYKASLNALTGTPMAATSSRRQSGNKMDDDQENDVEVGDTVSVPGGMTGVVKYLGSVDGKKGLFAGVELSSEYANRGKNDGDVDGIRYFTTSVPGAGIFLPSHRAAKSYSPSLTASTFPPTPTTPAFSKSDLSRKQLSISRTPPTPSIPKFSQSMGTGAKHPFSQTVGPSARAPSPQLKPKSRPSLPRPESPFRKQPNLQPATTGRGSVRGIRPSAMATPSTPRMSTPSKSSTIRSPSRSQLRQGGSDLSPVADSTPTPSVRPKVSMKSFNNQQPLGVSDEVRRLRKELDERDEQLRDQAISLAEMESNLAEVQSLMAATNSREASSAAPEAGTENADISELRFMLKSKQEKIDMLTKEFDKNRADFRSTIDTLEIAASTTEIIYEQQKQDLMREVEALRNGKEDVEQFQEQYKQFEEAVAELEEAVENARRGEAEAKAESEFLHGEVDRVRIELRREREKAANAVIGATAAVGANWPASPSASTSRDVEQRDDQIRGLKAIIANLTAGADTSSPSPKRGSLDADAEEALTARVQSLQREKSELKGLIDRVNFREEELERENARLRSASGLPNNYTNYAAVAHAPIGTSNHRHHESTSTATMHTANRNSATSTSTAIRSSTRGSYTTPPQSNSRPGSGSMPRPKSGAAEPLHEKDLDDASTTESSQADTDSQWCELCEAPGHDILTCSKMFGTDKDQLAKDSSPKTNGIEITEDADRTLTLSEPQPSRSSLERPAEAQSSARSSQEKPRQAEKEEEIPPALPMGDGPAPGKDSGKIDMTKWCAMCERDGHESVDCPFEEEY